MFRRTLSFLLLVLILMLSVANADSVVKVHYVFMDWSGEYTGQADSNGIPFGYGTFVSETPMEGEKWHYLGWWEDGLPEGEGAIYFENGNMQKGTFRKGVLTEGLKYTVIGLSATPVVIESSVPETEAMYIGNKNSKRFHLPTCRSVSQMKEKNRVEFSSREEAIEQQYIPCGDCNP